MENVEISIHHMPGTMVNQITVAFPHKIAVAITDEMMIQTNPVDITHHITRALLKEVEKEVLEQVSKIVNTKQAESSIGSFASFKDYYYTGDLVDEFSKWAPGPENYFKAIAPTAPASQSIEGALMDICAGLKEKVYCPVDGCTYSKKGNKELYATGYPLPLSTIIQHLNDSDHHWTREQIADWLETLDIDINIKEATNDED